MQKAGIDRFDVIDQAACLMANYETVSALAPLGKWLAGSEEIMIAHPLAPASFPPMGQGGSGEDVANGFVQGYVDLLDSIAVQPGGQAYRDLVAMSVVDGDAVANLDAALASFSQAAVANMPEITTAVARARAQALEFVAGFPGLEGESLDLVDLGDFMKHLTGVPDDVAVARDAVSAAVDRAVTLQATGQGTQQATGINVYLPANPRNVNQSVLDDGTEPQGWAEFVEAFVQSAGSSQGDIGAGVRFVSEQAQILQADASGIKIAAQLTDGSRANVTSAESYVFTELGGQQSALGLILPAYLDAGGPGQVQGVWNYAVTALTDGQTVAPATAVYQAQSGGLLGSFLAQYTAPNGGVSDIGVRVLLSSAGEIQSVSIVDASTGSSSGVSLELGGSLTPYVFVPSSGSYERVLSTQSIAGERGPRGRLRAAAGQDAVRHGSGRAGRRRQRRDRVRGGAGAVTEVAQVVLTLCASVRASVWARRPRGYWWSGGQPTRRSRWTCRSSIPSSRGGNDWWGPGRSRRATRCCPVTTSAV